MVNELPPPTYVSLLQELAEMRDTVRRLEFYIVRLMRETGLTWEGIGDELGISRQAARQRYQEPKNRRSQG